MAKPDDIFRRARIALDQAAETRRQEKLRQESDHRSVMQSLGREIVGLLQPLLDKIAGNARLNKEELKEAISSIKVEAPAVPQAQVKVDIPEIRVPEPRVTVNVPDIKVPEIKIPKITVPKPEVTVNVPETKIPDLKWPKEEMSIKGWVGLMGVDVNNPLPVQLRDAKGKPVNLFENLTQVIGSGGGVAKIVKVSDVLNTVGVVTIDPDGNPTYVSSGLTDTELRATAVPVSQVSGANWSVSVNDIFRTTVASNLINADDRLRVSLETGGSGLTDTELRASSVPVEQVSGSIWSVNVASGSTAGTEYTEEETAGPGDGGLAMARNSAGSVYAHRVGSGTSETALRVVHATDVGVSVTATQSGTWDIGTVTAVTDITNSVRVSTLPETIQTQLDAIETAVEIMDDWDETDRAKVNLITSQAGIAANQGETDGRTVRVIHAGDSGVSVTATQTGTWNIGTVTAVTDITNSVAAALVDSGGVQYSGSNPLPIDLVQALDHTIDSISVRQVSGANHSVQNKLIARQTNPTAASDAAEVFASADDLGRTITRPIQVRDLIATAYVSVSNGTETTLLTGASSTFHDLIYVMCANQSDAATFVDFRCGTAGTVIMTVQVPAEGTAGVSLPVPHKMPEVAQAWTVDLPDITGTTVDITAQFSKEI